jgi:hypothetical protein
LRAAVVAAEVLVGGLEPGVVAVEVGSLDPGVSVVVTGVVAVVDVGTVETGVVEVGAVAVPVVVDTVVVPVVLVVVVGVVVVVPVPWPVPVAVDAGVVPAVNPPPRGPRTVAPPGARCGLWPDGSAVTAAVVEVSAGVIVDRGAEPRVASCVVAAAAAPLAVGAEDDGVGMLACAICAAA